MWSTVTKPMFIAEGEGRLSLPEYDDGNDPLTGNIRIYDNGYVAIQHSEREVKMFPPSVQMEITFTNAVLSEGSE